MTQYLWIGCLENDEEFKIKAKKGYNLASAQVSQKNILYGIEEVGGMVFDSINGSVLPPFPIYEDRDIEPVTWEHKLGSFDISVGYRNDKYVNRINCKKAMIKAVDEWVANRYKNGKLIVIVYSLRSAPMAAAVRIKKKIPNAKLYIVITDLPQFMDLGQNKLKAVLKQIDWISIKGMQSKFDGFILYASKMAEYLEISDGKWLLMEGSYDASEGITNDETPSKKKAIMYSGKLDKEYGVSMLLDAFMLVKDKDVELWLTGGGNAEKYIKECAKKDGRIKFYGFLPSRADVLKKQREAMLLVNMRLPSEPASAYCFPSKLFEYMATGVPVLSFKLEGIPEKYYDYLIDVKECSAEALRDAINVALNMTSEERLELGRRGRTYILQNKNNIAQSKKILNFMNCVENDF